MIEGLKDKIVVVTGGGHGIGKAYYFGFARSGSRVIVADIDRPAPNRLLDKLQRRRRQNAKLRIRFFLGALCAFARDIPTFGCGEAALGSLWLNS
jgi:NAD(P)-dependent dehydrogenase (short-subunit alcohol dehydrogenase family)